MQGESSRRLRPSSPNDEKPPRDLFVSRSADCCFRSQARKVKCSATRPSCDACRRSARFRGDDPAAVVCSYFEGRRCSANGAIGRSGQRVRRAKHAATEDSDASSTASTESGGSVTPPSTAEPATSRPIPLVCFPLPPKISLTRPPRCIQVDTPLVRHPRRRNGCSVAAPPARPDAPPIQVHPDSA